MLAIELRGLIDLDFSIELTGFEMAEVDLLLYGEAGAKAPDRKIEDDIPPLPAPGTAIIGASPAAREHLRRSFGTPRQRPADFCFFDPLKGFFTCSVHYIIPIAGWFNEGVVMAEQTYGRGQLEWALWHSFAGAGSHSEVVPPIFRTRIKRLLEIDRALKLSNAEVPPEADYAFAPFPSSESGEAAYSAVDAFGLAIALDLLDAGFKQAEIVFLMRYLRPELQKRFPKLLELPSLIDRQRRRAQDHPDLPSYEDGGCRYADGRLFVILQKVELTEIIPPASGRHHAEPIVPEPVFCAGVTALGAELYDMMPDRRRTVTVLEVAATAQAVQTFLEEAPVIRRGRPKA
jgi:hypothetical protein